VAQGSPRPDPGGAGHVLTTRRRRSPPAATQLPLISAGPPDRRAWAGPFQPTLEDAWLAALARFRAADPLGAVWLLVPSRFLGLHLTRLAAHRGGAVNVHVLTFTDLAERLLEGTTTRPLPPAGELLALRQALREAVPPDGYFAPVRDSRRFPAALAATCAELRTAGVGPAELEQAARVAGRPSSADKLRELARLVGHANGRVAAAGFVYPTDALWAAAERVRAAAPSGGPTGLVAYGFIEWNAAERALLAALGRRLPLVPLVPAEPGPPFEPVHGLVEWLTSEGYAIERSPAPPHRGPQALAARLFRESISPGAGTEGLVIVAAPGEEREVREIARRLLAAAAAGVPFEAMGILVRRPDSYRAAIRDVFGAAGIPYTWGVAPSLGETRAGRSLRLLLATRQEDFARTAVVEWLAMASLRDASGVEPAEWDRLSREGGIVAGRGDWRRGLDRLAWRARRHAASPADAAEGEGAGLRAPDLAAVQALGHVIGRLLGSAGRLPDAAPAQTLARGLLRAFLRLCRRDGEAEPVAGLLSSFDALGPLAAPLGLDEFAVLLEAALLAPVEPGPEPRHGKVFVGELRQALGLPFRLVVLPGLVEQGFPAPPRQDPILLDEERELLHAQQPGGRPGLSLTTQRPAEERLAFRLAAAAAERELLLTYPRVDTPSGRARVPSFFLLRVAEAATGQPCDFTGLEAFPPHERVALVPAPPAARAAPLDRREWLLAQATRAREGGAAGRAACLTLLPRAARARAALEAREHGDRVSAWDGLLPAGLEAVLAAYHRAAGGPVAATPLEQYATCPFRYYQAHVLRVAPPVEPERVLTLGAADRGLLLHRILARAYMAFRDAGLLPLSPERVPVARDLLETVFAEEAASVGPTGLAPLWAGERVRLLTDLTAAIQAEAREPGGWVPTDFELPFGSEGAPSLAHVLPDGRRLDFRGRLDRLDVTADGSRARVIDYKSGRSRGAGGKLAAGTALQLPVYRLAAEVLCQARGLDAGVEEAQYYHLTRRGERRRLAFTAADWQARRDDFDRVLATVLDGIAAGQFFQNPSAETCRWCDYQMACGPLREREAWVERKRADPVRDAYARLGEIE
jgi:ATP-dependent helicase/nuclease subunit B